MNVRGRSQIRVLLGRPEHMFGNNLARIVALVSRTIDGKRTVIADVESTVPENRSVDCEECCQAS